MFENTRLCSKVTAILVSALWAVSACDDGGSVDDGVPPAVTAADSDEVAEKPDTESSDAPGPGNDVEAASGRAVISDRLPYAEVDEELVYGYFVFPADMVEPLPAVIMIHEWWGLNDHINAMADRLAAEGYIVLAVDLFGGKTASTPSEARQLMAYAIENPEEASENLRQAFRFVIDTAGAPSIGSLGWSFGGAWSLNVAMQFPDEVDAAVIYYGQVTDDDERLLPISAPVLGHFGADDRGISTESVQGFEAALQRLRKDYQIHIYPDARHAFANPTAAGYDERVAETAWQRTLEFLSQSLSPDAT